MNRFDVSEHVTRDLIAALEKGTVPWRRPWRELAQSGRAGCPVNLDGRPYRGFNDLALSWYVCARRFTAARFGTFNAIRAAGAAQRAVDTILGSDAPQESEEA